MQEKLKANWYVNVLYISYKNSTEFNGWTSSSANFLMPSCSNWFIHLNFVKFLYDMYRTLKNPQVVTKNIGEKNKGQMIIILESLYIHFIFFAGHDQTLKT